MDPFPKSGDHFAKWENRGIKNKKWNILLAKKVNDELGTDSQVKLLNTDSKDQLGIDSVAKDPPVQWRRGLATHQLKILESRRAMHKVNKRLFTHHGSLMGRLRPKKMLQAEIFSSTLSWNYDGSRLMAGGNDMLRIWSYPEGNLLHDFSTGVDSYGIHSARFIMEFPQRVVSGTHQVQLWDINNNNLELALFNCHPHRVAGVLAVEGSPNVIWSACRDATVRRHDLRQITRCDSSQCVQLDLNDTYLKLGEEPSGYYEIRSFDMNLARPHSILIGGTDCFARIFDTRNNQIVQYYCPKHLSTLGDKMKEINHVTFSWDGSEALINYKGDGVYLIDMQGYGANEPEEYGVEEVEELLKSMNELKVSDSGSKSKSNERGSSEKELEDCDFVSERGSSEESEEDCDYHSPVKSKEDCKNGVNKAFDITQRYVGHLNLGNCKKEANFIGREGEYIACGSDDGMLYIFEKRSAKPISRCLGHNYGLICVQSHPTELAIATSGFGIVNRDDETDIQIGGVDLNNEDVEQLVKIWTPDSVDHMALTEYDLQCMEENETYARDRLRQAPLPKLIMDQIHIRRHVWI